MRLSATSYLDWRWKNMKVYNEEDYLMLSGIQHFAFCPRQWALIHIENQWEENVRTVEGNIMHKRAHDGPADRNEKESGCFPSDESIF